MKNRYFKLKITLLLQTLLTTAITVLIIGIVLSIVGDNEQNTNFIMWYFILFGVFFYFTLSKLTKYLQQVEEGINNIVSDSMEPVLLTPELAPIEDKLNEIKMTIKQQEMEALESERKKNELVMFLAHDLKTPLTSIVGYLSILETKKHLSEAEKDKYINISLEKALRLGDLINEFFEITKFNLQDIKLDIACLDLSMMLEQIADELYGVLHSKELSCRVNIQEVLVVNGDADKLARVFDNILKNAIAYCYPKTQIEITAVEIEKYIKITIANSGARIPEDQLYAIFEMFYRLDEARSSITGGAGLGLVISKEIIELHGGKIYAESDDVQTRFIVLLPKVNEGRGR